MPKFALRSVQHILECVRAKGTQQYGARSGKANKQSIAGLDKLSHQQDSR